MERFTEGQEVPNFTLESTEGEISLYDLLDEAENGVVVYFYPRASTPGCTTEACDFRDSLSSLKGCGYTVVGVSPDKMPALEKFRDNQSLNFPLASDPEKQVMQEWAAYGEKKNYGKIVQGVIRSTVVVSPDRKVKLALYNVRAKGHVARLRKELGCDA
ncbi:MAG: peroxiredoxin [Actinomycetaceae bacterium]|nr:peroxiredoxin [Actinomycetaceae bacterium]